MKLSRGNGILSLYVNLIITYETSVCQISLFRARCTYTQVCDYSADVGDNMPKLVGSFYSKFSRPTYIRYLLSCFAIRGSEIFARYIFATQNAPASSPTKRVKDNC